METNNAAPDPKEQQKGLRAVTDLYPFVLDAARAMVFVDGENLTMRYQSLLGGVPPSDAMKAWHRPNVAVWSQTLNLSPSAIGGTRFIRRYFFTSEQGTEEKRLETVDWLKEKGFQIPRVFPRNKERGSKQVDISLSVEMLLHATRHHYDIAVLVAGDEDYVPLVRAVQSEGLRVHVWFVSDGIAPKLRREADHFGCLDTYLGLT